MVRYRLGIRLCHKQCIRLPTTVFAKTNLNITRTWNPIYLRLHSCTIQAHQVYMASNQFCFHRWLFADSVRSCWCTTGPVHEATGDNNKDAWGTKLLPMTILTYPLGCDYFCYLLQMQHYCLCPSGKYNPPPSAHPPTSLYAALMILQQLWMKLLKIQQCQLAGRNSYKNSSYKTTLLIAI